MKFVLFGVFTLLMLVFTLRRPHRHRFYRFLAFETLLGLILLNSKSWFVNPFSFQQILSWSFLFGSIILVVFAVILLVRIGEPENDFEDTQKLVVVGLYRWIRHPMYTSLILLGAGTFLKEISIASLALFIGTACFVYATAKVEEYENLEKFGEEYREYSKQSKMFLPYIF